MHTNGGSKLRRNADYLCFPSHQCSTYPSPYLLPAELECVGGMYWTQSSATASLTPGDLVNFGGVQNNNDHPLSDACLLTIIV
jgi:hypothetical protein